MNLIQDLFSIRGQGILGLPHDAHGGAVRVDEEAEAGADPRAGGDDDEPGEDLHHVCEAVLWDAAFPEVGWGVVDGVGGPVAGFADEAAEAGFFGHFSGGGSGLDGEVWKGGEGVPVAKRVFG